MATQHKWLPREPTEEMIEAAHYEWKYRPHASMKSAIKHMIIKAWEAAQEVEQEPAVYLVWHDGEFTYTKYPEEYQNTYEALPLYTHPPSKREPLSKEAIGSLWEMNGMEDNPVPFTKAIEKAHGIGE